MKARVGGLNIWFLVPPVCVPVGGQAGQPADGGQEQGQERLPTVRAGAWKELYFR